MFSVTNLYASSGQRKILKGVDLSIEPGSVHVLMGPNGSGKSTLANVLMGHPEYTVTQGSILFNRHPITQESTDQRARRGIFLVFQHPLTLPGVTAFSMLRQACQLKDGALFSSEQFQKSIEQACLLVGIDPLLLQRPLNDGFSGGEKKRLEMVQFLVLLPNLAIIDEIDSGLDVDGLKLVAAALAYARRKNPAMSILLITHYQRIVHYIKPDAVHIMYDGKIIAHGGAELASQIEQAGYASVGMHPSSQVGHHETG